MRHLTRPSFAFRRATAVFAAGAFAVLAACSDSPTAPDPLDPVEELEPAINVQRLLVADAEEPHARLLALQDDAVLDTYALSAPASYVYASTSGRFAGIQQRTADRVHFVDGGVWIHGDHAHREDPMLLPFQLNDGLPTHANVNGDWISVFFDGSGRATWVNEQDMLAGTPSVAFEVATGGPHHSGAATVEVDGAPYFIYAPLNPAGGLPNAVHVRDSDGNLVAEVSDCPVMHGNSATTGAAVFGCQDGMVLVRPSGSSVSAEKVAPSGEMEGLGLRNAWSASDASFILGQFSALPGEPTRRVLAIIDASSGALHPLPTLPDGVVDHFRAVEPVRSQVAILGTDGTLYVYDAVTRTLDHAVSGVVPAIPASGAMAHQVAVVENLAAVASPSTGQVVLVDMENGSVIRRIGVGGHPSRIAILGAKEAGMYEVED